MSARYEIQYKHPIDGWVPLPMYSTDDRTIVNKYWLEIARNERERWHLYRLVSIGVTVLRHGPKPRRAK